MRDLLPGDAVDGVRIRARHRLGVAEVPLDVRLRRGRIRCGGEADRIAVERPGAAARRPIRVRRADGAVVRHRKRSQTARQLIDVAEAVAGDHEVRVAVVLHDLAVVELAEDSRTDVAVAARGVLLVVILEVEALETGSGRKRDVDLAHIAGRRRFEQTQLVAAVREARLHEISVAPFQVLGRQRHA